MPKSNYYIVGNKIFADVSKLKPNELKTVKNYKELGYELIDKPMKETKEEKEKKRIENPYSKINVEKFLKEKGNEELFAEYRKRYDEQAGTNRKQTKDGEVVDVPNEPKYLKDGRPKKKGFANCIGWFTDMFTWDEEKKQYIKK